VVSVNCEPATLQHAAGCRPVGGSSRTDFCRNAWLQIRRSEHINETQPTASNTVDQKCCNDAIIAEQLIHFGRCKRERCTGVIYNRPRIHQPVLTAPYARRLADDATIRGEAELPVILEAGLSLIRMAMDSSSSPVSPGTAANFWRQQLQHAVSRQARAICRPTAGQPPRHKSR